jgi:hypothetical protein
MIIKAAKKLPGSSLIINRRMEESYSDWLTGGNEITMREVRG